ACDDIMKKVKKPTGLIRYSSEFEMQTKIKPSIFRQLIQPRVLLYGTLISIATVIFIVSIASRKEASLTLLRKTGDPYSEMILPDGSKQILNHVRVHLHNQGMNPLVFSLHTEGVDRNVEVITPIPVKTLKPNSSEDFIFVIRASEQWFKAQQGKQVITVNFHVEGGSKPIVLKQEVEIVGPR